MSRAKLFKTASKRNSYGCGRRRIDKINAIMTKEVDLISLAEMFDKMQGLEAQVMHRHFLGDYSHEQIAQDLDLSTQESIRIAADGLRRIKNQTFDT